MSVFWKLLAVLVLTMPPAAYVAGTVVGPPATVLAEDQPQPSRPSTEPPKGRSDPEGPARDRRQPAPQPAIGGGDDTTLTDAPEPRPVAPAPEAARDRVLEVRPPQERPDRRPEEVAGATAEKRGILAKPDEATDDQLEEGVTVVPDDEADEEPGDESGEWSTEDPEAPLTAVPDGMVVDPGE